MCYYDKGRAIVVPTWQSLAQDAGRELVSAESIRRRERVVRILVDQAVVVHPLHRPEHRQVRVAVQAKVRPQRRADEGDPCDGLDIVLEKVEQRLDTSHAAQRVDGREDRVVVAATRVPVELVVPGDHHRGNAGPVRVLDRPLDSIGELTDVPGEDQHVLANRLQVQGAELQVDVAHYPEAGHRSRSFCVTSRGGPLPSTA